MTKPASGSLKASKAKKGKGKKVTRNVLTLGSDDDWWPLIPEDKASEIRSILRKHLTVAHCFKAKVPWYILMKMTREQRKAKIEEAKKSLLFEEKETMIKANRSRKHVTIGLNMSVRNIEQKKLLFCLLDSTGQPKILVDKLLKLAKEQQLPVGLLPNLKEILKSIIGFSTSVLGFKKTMLEETCEIGECLPIRCILDSLKLKAQVGKPFKTEDRFPSRILKQERLDNILFLRGLNSKRVFIPDTPSLKTGPNYIQIGLSSGRTNVVKKTFKRYTDHKMLDPSESDSKKFESPMIVTFQSNPNKSRNK